MQKLNFSTVINADRSKVWKSLWEIPNYEKWTTVFAEGSTSKTDNWKEGTKVYFVDGSGAGMVSMIAANKPNEFMSFKHLGMIKDGVEKFEGDKIEQWAGAMENYTLTDVGGKTELGVEIDVADDHKEYFDKTWPLALQRIKELSEN